MRYHFKIHKETKGYWAECLELPGCHSQGDSVNKLEKNLSEALHAFLDEPADSKQLVPLPNYKLKGRGIREVPVEPRMAFAVLLRNVRLSHGLTQKALADRLGFKGLYSYQRLESAKTANPELQTIAKIKKEFPEISLDEILSS